MRQGQRFAAIDGLRGVAILMVTFLHLWQVAGEPAWKLAGIEFGRWPGYGAEGVNLFFALSGFCLFYPVIKRGAFAFDARNFFLRRTLRIWPAHFVGVLAWLAIWGEAVNWQGWKRQFFTHLSFTHTLFPDTIMSFNAVLWSLGTEIHFYFAFPLIAYLVYRWPWRSLAYSAALSFGFACWSALARQPGEGYDSWSTVIGASLPARTWYFVMGMVAAHCLVRYPNPSRPVVAAAWAVGLFALAVRPFFRPAWGLNAAMMFTVPAWGILIYAATTSSARVLRLWPLTALGVISYSLYIYNPLMYHVPSFLTRSLAHGSAAWWSVTAGVVLAAGIVGYLVTEKPFLALRERLRNIGTRPVHQD